MAVIRIDSFTYEERGIESGEFSPIEGNNSGEVATSNRYLVSVYFDEETRDITSDMVSDSGQTAATPGYLDIYKTNRYYTEGQTISRICQDTTGLTFLASNSAPFATLETEANASFCANTNPSCDLRITGIETQNETAEGAADGLIKATAVSSNMPIRYRLDGGSWRTTGEFSMLAPKTYKLDSEDALGCFKTENVTIEESRQILIETPTRELPSGNISRWSAVFNPIVFRYQRKDMRVTFMRQDYGAFMVVYVNKVLSAEEQETLTDSRVYVNTPTRKFAARAYGVFYNDRPNETGISITDYPQFFVEPDETDGFLNVLNTKVGHRFVTEITMGAEYRKKVLVARHSASPTGIARADISTYLKQELAAKDEFKYNVRNERDLNLGCSFAVRFREEWDNGAGEWTSAGDPFYATFSALQLGNEHGSNMAKYVPFLNEPNNSRLAYFLTDFKEPVLYMGLPFDLAFIYSEELVGKAVKLKEVPLSINYSQLAGGADSVLLNEAGGALLNENGGRLMSSLLIENNSISVVPQLGVNRLQLSGVYPAQARFVEVYLYIDNGGGNEQQITQKLRIKIEQKPTCDYKYFKWLNPLGGWSYSLFEYRIEHDLDVGDTVTINRFVDDYKTATTVEDVISREANRKETVGRNSVPGEELNSLSSIFFSVKVYLLTQENPRQWQTVIVDSKGVKLFNTKDEVGDFEMTYRLPSLNLQRQ